MGLSAGGTSCNLMTRGNWLDYTPDKIRVKCNVILRGLRIWGNQGMIFEDNSLNIPAYEYFMVDLENLYGTNTGIEQIEFHHDWHDPEPNNEGGVIMKIECGPQQIPTWWNATNEFSGDPDYGVNYTVGQGWSFEDAMPS